MKDPDTDRGQGLKNCVSKARADTGNRQQLDEMGSSTRSLNSMSEMEPLGARSAKWEKNTVERTNMRLNTCYEIFAGLTKYFLALKARKICRFVCCTRLTLSVVLSFPLASMSLRERTDKSILSPPNI